MLINPRTRKPFRLLREFDTNDAYNISLFLQKKYPSQYKNCVGFLSWFDDFKDTIELVNVSKELNINIY